MKKEDQLIDAAENGYLQEVKKLIESGVDIHVYDDDALRSDAEFGFFGNRQISSRKRCQCSCKK